MEPDRERVYSRQQFLSVDQAFGITQVCERKGSGWLHRHEFIEVSYVFAGEGTYYFRQGETVEAGRVSRGDVTIVDPSAFHCFVSDEGSAPVVTYNIMFTPGFFDAHLSGFSRLQELRFSHLFSDLRMDLDAAPVVRLPAPDQSFFDDTAGRIFAELSGKQPGYTSLIRAYVVEMVVRLVRVLFYRGGALSGKAKSYRVVQALTDAVDRTYREPLDLSSLAREFFFTPGYLCRVFKQETGMTLTAYRQKLRVEEACRRLVDTDEPITDIAHEVGYCDYKAFYSVFLKQTGLRPSAYRRRNRLEVPSGVTGGPAEKTEGKERSCK